MMSESLMSATAANTTEVVSIIVQAAAVVVALAASTTALIRSVGDRKTLIQISAQTRRHDRLRTELDYAIRLSANRNRGGSSDKEESARLGAEALALALVVGQRWVPEQFTRATDNKSSDEIASLLAAPETAEHPLWVRDKMEAGLAVQRIMDELYDVGEPSKRGN